MKPIEIIVIIACVLIVGLVIAKSIIDKKISILFRYLFFS